MSPWILTLLVAALVQSTLLSGLSLLGARPNLVLAMVLCWTLLRGGREGLIWAMAGGLLFDLFSTAPFGTFTVAMLVTIFTVGLTEAALVRRTALLPLLLMLVASPLFHLVAIVMMMSLGWARGWGSALPILPVAALLDGAATLLLFPLVARIAQLAGERTIDWRQSG